MPGPLRAHDRDHLPCQVVPAEQIGFENVTQRFDRKVLDSRIEPVGAVVEQGVEPPARGRQNGGKTSADALGVAIVDAWRCKAFRGQPVAIGLLPA